MKPQALILSLFLLATSTLGYAKQTAANTHLQAEKQTSDALNQKVEEYSKIVITQLNRGKIPEYPAYVGMTVNEKKELCFPEFIKKQGMIQIHDSANKGQNAFNDNQNNQNEGQNDPIKMIAPQPVRYVFYSTQKQNSNIWVTEYAFEQPKYISSPPSGIRNIIWIEIDHQLYLLKLDVQDLAYNIEENALREKMNKWD